MWISVGSFLAVPMVSSLNTSIAGCAWNATGYLNSTVGFHELDDISQDVSV